MKNLSTSNDWNLMEKFNTKSLTPLRSNYIDDKARF